MAVNHRRQPGQIFRVSERRGTAELRECDPLAIGEIVSGDQLQHSWGGDRSPGQVIARLGERFTPDFPQDHSG